MEWSGEMVWYDGPNYVMRFANANVTAEASQSDTDGNGAATAICRAALLAVLEVDE